MGRVRGRFVAVFVISLGAVPSVAFSQPTSQQPSTQPPPVTYNVDVIETLPLPAVNLTIEQIPAPVQVASNREIDASGALELSDFLNRRFNGVFSNEIQGNPFQTDLNYRGYTASPLLGTPQGVSVYLDGVRLNQPFGDVVSWDLIPRVAIGTTTLMPGSNPLFGLNTLGGALAIQTKDGSTSPGTSVRAIYGSHLRRSIEAEHGGSRANGLNWYLAGNLFAEDGWRDASPSSIGQAFGKLGKRSATTEASLAVGYADNSLTGNGLQEQRLLAADYASIYTQPDETDNRATFINFKARHDRSNTFSLTGNVYYRDIRTHTLNGDINEDSLDQSVYQPNAAEQRALADAGYSGFPTSGENASNTPFPSWRCIANVLLVDEPGEKCNGLLNRTQSVQHNYGGSGQLTWRDWVAGKNVLTIGAAYDGSRTSFQQSTQLGYLNPDRGVTPLDAFADGVTGGTVDGEPYDNRVSLDGHANTGSVFASDVLPLGAKWNVSLSARFNSVHISNLDNLNPGGGPGSLDGDHTFNRLNPAAGVTYSPTPALNTYAGYSEGSRAPTSIELGCADPEQPCKLPNALAGDPPLDQVVTRTFEAGIRQTRGIVSWNAGAFFASNHDDILFVSSTATGFGYFKNFGNTRRAGLEASAHVRKGPVTGGIGYTFLNATFQSSETVDGTGNSTNDEAEAGVPGVEGTIQIEPGDHIPLIPRHMFKVYTDISVTPRLSVDIDLLAASGVFARGNENNLSEPDGVYYLGPGSTDPYAIVNLGAQYRVKKWIQVVGQINNLFDRHYATAAQLGPTGFTSAGNYIARPLPPIDGEFPIPQATFSAPGAPTTLWIGTRVTF
jgi:outer membrane receptor protein involved in Fe transport